jgi:cytochrome c
MGVFVSCFVLSSAAAFSEEKRGTADEAVAMVKKAVHYIKQHGKEKAFAEFSNPKGQFVDRDLYITVFDMNGNCLAHGFNQKMIGKNMLDLKDPDGKAMVKDRSEMAKTKEEFWMDYKFSDPITRTLKQKSMYSQRSGDLIINCGIYKD